VLATHRVNGGVKVELVVEGALAGGRVRYSSLPSEVHKVWMTDLCGGRLVLE